MVEKIALILPTYNEELGIEKSIVATKTLGANIKTVFIDDGSTDRTLYILEKNINNETQILVRSATNGGYGSACLLGTSYAIANGFSWVIFADCDLTNPVSDILKLVARIEQSPNLDLIKGDRFHPGGDLKNIQLKRRIMSRLARQFSRRCFRNYVSDPTNGFRAVRTEILKNSSIVSKDFSIILEELYFLKSNHAVAANFPTTLYSRGENVRATSFIYSKDLVQRYLWWCKKAYTEFD
jgi:dolichol-phosphate mannosyltransferase